MPFYENQQHSDYTPRQLFDLVLDVERYPEFLPWVSSAKILTQHADSMEAELRIAFKAISASYVSRITWQQPDKNTQSQGYIDVRLIEGPFKHLYNHWNFKPDDPNGTLISFEIDFSFRSVMFQRMIGMLFERAVKKMVTAFNQRADELYGKV